MWDLVAGAMLGTLTSVMIAEIYQVRANREMDLRLKKIQLLGESLDSILQDVQYFAQLAGEKADAAKEQAKQAWLAGVRGTPEDPDFPYK